MMKQLVSILLSMLLLVSSSGVTYAQHFCGGFEMLSKITLGEEFLSCGMTMENASCGDEKDEKHGCCDNEYTNVDTDDNFVKASFDIEFQPVITAVFVPTLHLQHENSFDTLSKDYAKYHPPPLIEDLQILYDTFLI